MLADPAEGDPLVRRSELRCRGAAGNLVTPRRQPQNWAIGILQPATTSGGRERRISFAVLGGLWRWAPGRLAWRPECQLSRAHRRCKCQRCRWREPLDTSRRSTRPCAQCAQPGHHNPGRGRSGTARLHVDTTAWVRRPGVGAAGAAGTAGAAEGAEQPLSRLRRAFDDHLPLKTFFARDVRRARTGAAHEACGAVPDVGLAARAAVRVGGKRSISVDPLAA